MENELTKSLTPRIKWETMSEWKRLFIMFMLGWSLAWVTSLSLAAVAYYNPSWVLHLLDKL